MRWDGQSTGSKLAVLLAVALMATLRAQGAPRVVARQTTVDFGRIGDDQRVSHTFELRNEGDAPLRLPRVVSNCGCAVLTLSADAIAPGETATLEVELNPAGRSGRTLKAVSVATNDPGTPMLQFMLRAWIVPTPRTRTSDPVAAGETIVGVRASPARIERSGEPPHDAVLVVSSGGAAFRVLEVTTPWSSCQVDIRRLGDTAFRLALSGIPALKQGENAEVVVETTHPEMPRLRVPVSHASVRDDDEERLALSREGGTP